MIKVLLFLKEMFMLKVCVVDSKSIDVGDSFYENSKTLKDEFGDFVGEKSFVGVEEGGNIDSKEIVLRRRT